MLLGYRGPCFWLSSNIAGNRMQSAHMRSIPRLSLWKNIVITAAFMAAPAAVSAQQAGQTSSSVLNAPPFDTIDSNGVDLLTGRFRLRSPVLSMGNKSSLGEFFFTWTGQSWLPNTPHLWLDKDRDWKIDIDYDGVSEEFGDAVKGQSVQNLGTEFTYKELTPNIGSSLICYFTGGLSGDGWISHCGYLSRQGVSISFWGFLPYNGGFPNASFYSLQAYGNTLTWPGHKTDPARGSTNFLTESTVIGPYNTGGFIVMDMPDGFRVATTQGNYNDKTVVITLFNKSIATATQSLTISTSNLDPSNEKDSYLHPKGVTQTIIDPLGRVYSYTFDSNGDMTGLSTPGGITSTLGYDNSHRVTSYAVGGLTWTYSYDFSDKSSGSGTTTATDPNGRKRYISHTKKPGPVTTVTEEVSSGLSRTTTYGYDTYDRITSITYPEGNKTTYTYDTTLGTAARGNVTTVSMVGKAGGAGLNTTATYESGCASSVTCNKPLSITDPLLNTTNLSYDTTSGLLAKITYPAAPNGVRPETRNTYVSMGYYYKDSNGNIVQATDRLVPRLTQTSSCQVSSATATPSCIGTSDEALTIYSYGFVDGTAANNLLPKSIASRAGDGSVTPAVTAYGYDAAGNVLTVDGPRTDVVDVTTNRYDADRQLIGTVYALPDPGSSAKRAAVRYTYNPDGRTTLVETGTVNGTSNSDWSAFATAQRQATAYDSRGRPATIASAGTAATLTVQQMSYDALSRPACTAVRMNANRFPTVSAGGVLTGGTLPSDACAQSDTAPNNVDRIERDSYDYVGQLVLTERAVGTSLLQNYAAYIYSLNGKKTYITDADGNKARLCYDEFDQENRWIFPSKTMKGSTSGVNDADTACAVNSASDYEEYGYDANANRTSLRKRDGQLINYGYDALNRITLKDISGSSSLDVYYAYNNFGLQTAALYGSSGGLGIGKVYDALNRIVASTNNSGGTARTLSYQYDPAGNRTQITYPDTQPFNYRYDPLNRLIAVTDGSSSPLVSITYDDLGRRSGLSTGASPATKTSYCYDGIGRMNLMFRDVAGSISSATCANAVPSNVFWAFSQNPANQIVTVQLSNESYVYLGDYNQSQGYTVNGLNEYTNLSSTPATYSANGNLATACVWIINGTCGTGSTVTYSYDVENRLTAATGAKNLTLSYDPAGRLFQTSGPTTGTIQYLYDGDQLAGEYDNFNTLIRRYVHGADVDEPLVWYEGSGVSPQARRYLLPDWQGSVVTVADNNGNPVQINSYSAYGIPNPRNLGRFQYTSQIWLAGVGLYYYKSRLYSPELGRFLQTDPVGYDDQINLYTYVANDPVNHADPSGNCAEDLCIVEGGIGLAALSDAVFGTTIIAGGAAIIHNVVTHMTGDHHEAPLPDKLVGTPPNDRQGKRTNSGPLDPAHGGTGDSKGDFDKLTGGRNAPAPDSKGYPEGTHIGDNGIAHRPGASDEGPRIDIPSNGDKPHETLHYPPVAPSIPLPPPPPKLDIR